MEIWDVLVGFSRLTCDSKFSIDSAKSSTYITMELTIIKLDSDYNLFKLNFLTPGVFERDVIAYSNDVTA